MLLLHQLRPGDGGEEAPGGGDDAGGSANSDGDSSSDSSSSESKKKKKSKKKSKKKDKKSSKEKAKKQTTEAKRLKQAQKDAASNEREAKKLAERESREAAKQQASEAKAIETATKKLNAKGVSAAKSVVAKLDKAIISVQKTLRSPGAHLADVAGLNQRLDLLTAEHANASGVAAGIRAGSEFEQPANLKELIEGAKRFEVLFLLTCRTMLAGQR